jgi:uncharacterized delta-60 repeat protein
MNGEKGKQMKCYWLSILPFVLAIVLGACVSAPLAPPSPVQSSFEEQALLQPGQYDADFALARYNPDGSLDVNFGSNGLVTTTLPVEGGANSGSDLFPKMVNPLIVQPDGKILALGHTKIGLDAMNDTRQIALVRYKPDGALDTSYGEEGFVLPAIEGERLAMILQADGGLLLIAGEDNRSRLMRYKPDGIRDATFGEKGVVPLSLQVKSMLVQADSSIIVAGYVYSQ